MITEKLTYVLMDYFLTCIFKLPILLFKDLLPVCLNLMIVS